MEAVLFDWGDTLFRSAFDDGILLAGWEAGLAAIGRDGLPDHRETAARFRDHYLPLISADDALDEVDYEAMIRELLDGTLPAGTYKQTARCVTDELIPVLFEEPLAGELAGLARRRLLGLVEAESGSPLVRIQQFSFQSNRRQMLWGTELFRDDLVARDPFHDAGVVDHCRRIPEELRIGGIVREHGHHRVTMTTTLLGQQDIFSISET